ncbi:MAG: TetR family transcriptional regulator [Pedobacter sp.]|nr:TetR family transcriptional regulator [Pedobacter sp.]
MPTSSREKKQELPAASKPVSGALVRPYLGASAEDRVGGRRQKLIETAFALMASEGWRQVSIDALCREAKLNKRYFYESFANLDELAAAVVDDIAAKLMEMALAAAGEASASGQSTEVIALRALRIVIEYLTDDERRARVLFTEIVDSPQALAHRHMAIQSLAQSLSDFGHEHHKAGKLTDPIAAVTASLLVGGSMEVILNWLDGRIVMPRDQLIEDIAALWILAGDGAVARARARQKPKPKAEKKKPA